MSLLSSGLTWSRLRSLLVLSVALGVSTPPARAARAETAIGLIAVLDSLSGDSTIVEGKVVYVDFWASWCVPCRRSFPWMMELLGKYQERGLQIVTVNVDPSRAAADKFVEGTRASLPIVYDPAGKLARLYDLQALPTSFVYGRDGTLRSRQEGFRSGEIGAVESLIRTLLEEKEPQ